MTVRISRSYTAAIERMKLSGFPATGPVFVSKDRLTGEPA